MAGDFIDIFRCTLKKRQTNLTNNFSIVSTNFGKVRVFDSRGNKPVIISVPDGPNIIEHHNNLISKLSHNFRVICFEFIGLGYSYPNFKYDYSFNKASLLVINLMDILRIEKAALCFSCSNGFYAIKTAELFPDRIVHLFLSQTPSINEMVKWTHKSIPKVLRYPIVGQLVNSFSEKKLAKTWYKYALPKDTDKLNFVNPAIKMLNNGGCFCLSGLVQGLENESESVLKVLEVPSTLIWGTKDFTHRRTNNKSILEHLPNCEIIEFENCGHFPELEDTNRYIKLLKERLTT
ncbi:alpha/beta fold hydrolase [Algibacter pectinivorans]|uniref:Pimeloyl-ACP methyl ester carboxylesterase n=1 Tax=Algibacter pectinivorans TaxID=870482 RepID=A0A1I1P657_9FLAO|nr:alpha/beta hydrolase [Algibacter pectinivorans]SFD05156.1 Pimeloyl-ACP methyl ester carboxylesterase [Algibacter pectinivorans]